jgi:hypothetical protein
VLEQELFDVNLIGAMQRLRHLIGLGRGAILSLGFRRRRHRQPRQFEAAEAGEIDHVGRMIGGQAEAPQRCRNAEPPVMLHGARALRASFRMPARRLLGVEQHTAHAVPVEQQRQHQPDRPAADDEDRRGERGGGCGAGHVSSSLFFTLTSPRAKKLS